MPGAVTTHGTRSSYVAGCRCEECRAATNAYMATRRDARRKANPPLCPVCGKGFVRSGRQKYCSLECRSQVSGMVQANCATCGIEFRTQGTRARRGPVYCSKPCYGKWRSTLKGSANPLWGGHNVTYSAVHHWVNTNWVRMHACDQCGQRVGYTEWANLDGHYNRDDPQSWAELCAPCHGRLDSAGGAIEKFQLWASQNGGFPWGS